MRTKGLIGSFEDRDTFSVIFVAQKIYYTASGADRCSINAGWLVGWMARSTTQTPVDHSECHHHCPLAYKYYSLFSCTLSQQKMKRPCLVGRG